MTVLFSPPKSEIVRLVANMFSILSQCHNYLIIQCKMEKFNLYSMLLS